ncbi:hypothetical protein [Paenibacillus ginsengarvi]|uniref:Uncharacterized protein n=1 Tax=Paenibacillus ginsengarvi TaxID=400777 RepID=A0A3B0CSB6_9BACL|nr:hypothetical protein [Paenibacillus ginsengarvi]RKN85846.1 hypothetical protein D7M11_05800 [Paenibacillus ginsengarvi]
MAKRSSGKANEAIVPRKTEKESDTLYTNGPSVLKGDVVFRKVASIPTIFLHPRDAFAKLKA